MEDDIHPDDAKKLAGLLLLSPRTGKPMRFTSKLQAHRDGSVSFEVENRETGERYRMTFTIEEIIDEHRRAFH
jgi:hypothetical protein